MPCKLVYGQSDIIADWVSRRIWGDTRGFGSCQAVGVSRGGLIAGVVFHNWVPETRVIEVSAAAVSPEWATRSVLTELLNYPFGHLGCRLVVARHSEKNTRARKLWNAMRAVEYIIPDLRGDGEGEAIAVLYAQDWPKSRLYDGQKQSTEAA